MNLTITAQRCGRLSSFLKGELKMSSGLINRLKWGDSLRVNDTPVHTNHTVNTGDLITVVLEEEKPEYPAEAGNITVIFEDDWILAVDKPSGMLIHPSHSCFSGTLANYVQGYLQEKGQQCAFHPITRLDRDTFGIVLLAKNSHIHALLQDAHPKKTYHALVYGIPSQNAGFINAPIARKPLPSLLREINPDGKPCETEYRILETYENTAKLQLSPITGRTHQLRLHCAHIGCPIVGDPQYGTLESQAWSESNGFFTQQLCAAELEFIHPITGELLTIKSNMDV